MPILFRLPVIVLLLLCQHAQGQNKYWVFFTDKGKPAKGISYLSTATTSTRQALGLERLSWSDLPVKPSYINSLQQKNIPVICVSKWFNAVSVHLTKKQVTAIRQLGFIKSVQPIQTSLHETSLGELPGDNPWQWAFSEVNAASIVTQHLTGKGVKVGIIDGGFKGADQNKYLRQLIDDGKVMEMKDFVDPTVRSLFNPQLPGSSSHGMFVLQMLGGYSIKENTQYGLATQANYYLARTDDANIETRQEEDYWIRALEWMDSMGVRLVNSSLGYSHYFDNPADNYKAADMNGQTSTIAKAAQLAVEKKGMIIVSSIGNEGTDSTWQILTTPSDAPGVISVGAADIDYWFKPSFSSIGPPFQSYLKPNIACPTADGTSFSAPFITGLIACMLERKPGLTNTEVKEIIERSGHLYPFGNNYVGYGLPNGERILKLLEDPHYNFNRSEEIVATGDSIVLFLNKYREKPGEILTFFFKKDKYTVNLQAISDDDRFVLRRRKNIPRITIASRTKVVEVVWQ